MLVDALEKSDAAGWSAADKRGQGGGVQGQGELCDDVT